MFMPSGNRVPVQLGPTAINPQFRSGMRPRHPMVLKAAQQAAAIRAGMPNSNGNHGQNGNHGGKKTEDSPKKEHESRSVTPNKADLKEKLQRALQSKEKKPVVTPSTSSNESRKESNSNTSATPQKTAAVKRVTPTTSASATPESKTPLTKEQLKAKVISLKGTGGAGAAKFKALQDQNQGQNQIKAQGQTKSEATTSQAHKTGATSTPVKAVQGQTTRSTQPQGVSPTITTPKQTTNTGGVTTTSVTRPVKVVKNTAAPTGSAPKTTGATVVAGETAGRRIVQLNSTVNKTEEGEVTQVNKRQQQQNQRVQNQKTSTPAINSTLEEKTIIQNPEENKSKGTAEAARLKALALANIQKAKLQAKGAETSNQSNTKPTTTVIQTSAARTQTKQTPTNKTTTTTTTKATTSTQPITTVTKPTTTATAVTTTTAKKVPTTEVKTVTPSTTTGTASTTGKVVTPTTTTSTTTPKDEDSKKSLSSTTPITNVATTGNRIISLGTKSKAPVGNTSVSTIGNNQAVAKPQVKAVQEKKMLNSGQTVVAGGQNSQTTTSKQVAAGSTPINLNQTISLSGLTGSARRTGSGQGQGQAVGTKTAETSLGIENTKKSEQESKDGKTGTAPIVGVQGNQNGKKTSTPVGNVAKLNQGQSGGVNKETKNGVPGGASSTNRPQIVNLGNMKRNRPVTASTARKPDLLTNSEKDIKMTEDDHEEGEIVAEETKQGIEEEKMEIDGGQKSTTDPKVAQKPKIISLKSTPSTKATDSVKPKNSTTTQGKIVQSAPKVVKTVTKSSSEVAKNNDVQMRDDDDNNTNTNEHDAMTISRNQTSETIPEGSTTTNTKPTTTANTTPMTTNNPSTTKPKTPIVTTTVKPSTTTPSTNSTTTTTTATTSSAAPKMVSLSSNTSGIGQVNRPLKKQLAEDRKELPKKVVDVVAADNKANKEAAAAAAANEMKRKRRLKYQQALIKCRNSSQKLEKALQSIETKSSPSNSEATSTWITDSKFSLASRVQCLENYWVQEEKKSEELHKLLQSLVKKS
eukprot:CAMPEP_0115002066 /NCGR_PEP_ID=MMETSP0216-20121206/17782_1 /TAXON_ID=223996 /ORGANISM="Protocruzia adherens, Strain Boccale" /LENGTH=1030 /DNA_ID=CAMNT_0002367585 /DNA_START=282 /DNA_END=3374 /DNA_ORIENTATION=-